MSGTSPPWHVYSSTGSKNTHNAIYAAVNHTCGYRFTQTRMNNTKKCPKSFIFIYLRNSQTLGFEINSLSFVKVKDLDPNESRLSTQRVNN